MASTTAMESICKLVNNTMTQTVNNTIRPADISHCANLEPTADPTSWSKQQLMMAHLLVGQHNGPPQMVGQHNGPPQMVGQHNGPPQMVGQHNDPPPGRATQWSTSNGRATQWSTSNGRATQ